MSTLIQKTHGEKGQTVIKVLPLVVLLTKAISAMVQQCLQLVKLITGSLKFEDTAMIM